MRGTSFCFKNAINASFPIGRLPFLRCFIYCVRSCKRSSLFTSPPSVVFSPVNVSPYTIQGCPSTSLSKNVISPLNPVISCVKWSCIPGVTTWPTIFVAANSRIAISFLYSRDFLKYLCNSGFSALQGIFWCFSKTVYAMRYASWNLFSLLASLTWPSLNTKLNKDFIIFVIAFFC